MPDDDRQNTAVTQSMHKQGRPGLISAALHGLCPRCGARALFAGIVNLSDSCSACGLSYIRFNMSGRLAAFITLMIAALITGAALWLDAGLRPPFWVHVVLWVPITSAAVLLGLRIATAWLLHIGYRRSVGPADGGHL